MKNSINCEYCKEVIKYVKEKYKDDLDKIIDNSYMLSLKNNL